MQAAAKTLDLSDDELKSKLRSGSSLTEVAEQQGVSKQDLTRSLAESIKSSSSGTVDATPMATKMVDRKGPGGPRPTDKAETNTSTLAETLGLNADLLLEQLQNGDQLDQPHVIEPTVGGEIVRSVDQHDGEPARRSPRAGSRWP